jgi:hypothetical protein
MVSVLIQFAHFYCHEHFEGYALEIYEQPVHEEVIKRFEEYSEMD